MKDIASGEAPSDEAIYEEFDKFDVNNDETVDKVEFKEPVFLGDWVNCESKVIRTGNSSLEIEIKAFAESKDHGQRLACTANITFVAVIRDDEGKLIKFNHSGNFDRAMALMVGMYHTRELYNAEVKETLEDRAVDEWFDSNYYQCYIYNIRNKIIKILFNSLK